MDRDIYQYKPKYTLSYTYGKPIHMWSVQCAEGGIHLHIHDHTDSEHMPERYSGGIEVHYRTPPAYFRDKPPTDDRCFLIGGPCWSDGSSLAATDYWIPIWGGGSLSHEIMFRKLVGEMLKIFEREKEHV